MARLNILGQHWKMMDRQQHCDHQGEGRHVADAVLVPLVLDSSMILLHDRSRDMVGGT